MSVISSHVVDLRYQVSGDAGSLAKPEMFRKNQDYVQLKENYLRKGKLFVDSSFPPDSSSLGYLAELPCYMKGRVEWLRAPEILKAQNVSLEPTFFVESASRFDYSQGQVGNCWFLAAVASLQFQKDLLVQVVPLEQNFMDYAGIFHFRFWRFGKWVDVVVDDYLPTFQKKLLSVSSTKSTNQFWVALLEKAYAKLYGSYRLMNEAYPVDAFKDFFGGFHMSYRLQQVVDKKQVELLWASLNRAVAYKSMMCCSTAMRGDVMINTVSDTGLLSCHTYIVTKVAEVYNSASQEKHMLVRVMNPWGAQKWTGKWSDNSSVWETISCEDRGKLIKKDDGEFWMEFQDFLMYFHMLTVFCENPSFMGGELKSQWRSMSFDGKWIAGTSAGGSLSKSTFWMNPQYRLTVAGVDQTEFKVLLSLMQKPSKLQDSRLRATGYTIYEVPAGTPEGRLGASFFSSTASLMRFYGFDRDLTQEISLKSGQYLLVPSFMESNESGEYFFSITANVETTIVENVEVEEVIVTRTTMVTLPTEKEVVFDMFKKYVAEDGEVVVDAKQMMMLLNEHVVSDLKVKFDWSVCKSMLAMVDTERTGKLTFTQFTVLWSKFAVFMKIFYQLNVSKSGTLTFEELKKAVKVAGIELNENILKMQYTMLKESSYISLVDFLMFMLRMDSMSSGVFASVALSTEKEVVYDMVKKYADQDGEVELNETQMMMLLNEHVVAGLTEKFDWSVCKSMLTMVDTERVGKLTFAQFTVLWTKFATFRKIFYQLNVSKSGILSFEELQKALKVAGIELDENVLKMKYAILQERSYVSLVDFLMFMLRIDSMSSGVVASHTLSTEKEVVFDMFKKYADGDGEAVVDAKQMMMLLNEHVVGDLTEKFDWSVCKSMLSVVDTERTGKVTFTQFTVLWTKFAAFMKIFYQLNVSKSGTLTFEDLQKALKIAGIGYNENILKMQYILLRSRSYVSLVDFFMFMLRMDSMSRGVFTLVTLPTEKEVVYDMFQKYADLDGELSLDASKLMMLLNEHVVNGLTEKFDWTVCKSMLAMIDTERVGTLTFSQFTVLWGKFAGFMKIFYQLILLKSETLTFEDLQKALKVAGIELEANILKMQYMQLQERPTISLVDFLMFMLRLDSMSSGAFALVTLPTEKEVVYDMFQKYADREGDELMMSSKQMMMLLNERVVIGLTEKFDWSVCKSMLAMMDTERVGKLTFTQFTVMWSKFAVFMKIYFQSNVFKSGTLTFEEVQNALKVAGIKVNEKVLKMQYSMLQADSYISLVDFLMFMLRLDNMSSAVVALVSLPTEKEVVLKMFNKYADQENGEMMMNAKRMMMLLNEQVVAGLTEKFDWGACKSMLAMVDIERMGKLTFTQFYVMWSKLAVFMKIFYESNVSKSGTMTFEEMQNALKVAGIELDENVMKMQYAILRADPFISLVDFIMFMLRCDSMAVTFKVKDVVTRNGKETVIRDGTGLVTSSSMSWSEWSKVTNGDQITTTVTSVPSSYQMSTMTCEPSSYQMSTMTCEPTYEIHTVTMSSDQI